MHRSKRILDEFIHSPIVPAYRMYNIIFFISNTIYVTFCFNSSQKIATHFGWSISILYFNSIQFNFQIHNVYFFNKKYFAYTKNLSKFNNI